MALMIVGVGMLSLGRCGRISSLRSGMPSLSPCLIPHVPQQILELFCSKCGSSTDLAEFAGQLGKTTGWFRTLGRWQSVSN
jgi:hypothetical protein